MSGNINIRMYNVGFGDCFLVTLPTGDGDRKILIDCGTIKKKKESIEDIAKQVIEDVTVDGKARIDVLVLSHRHEDHLSGFAKKLWDEVEVGEVWMPWVESLTDPAARRIRNELAATARNLRSAVALLGLDADRIGAVALNALSDEGALGTLHRGFKGKPERRFFPKSKAGVVEAIETPLLPGIDIFVMGPPHDDKALNHPEPPEGQSLLTGFSVNPDGITKGEKFQPFGVGWIEESNLMTEEDKEKINSAASMVAAYELAAAKLDADINNTSLILLFRVGDEYLLFPGDAQWGPWELVLGDVEAVELLEKVTFLKISHHSSHNGTPASLLREVIGKNNAHNGVVQAMVSMTPRKGWEGIPHEPILTLLTKKNFPFCVSDRTTVDPPNGFARNGSLSHDLNIPV
jgi:beta-lactamase superfamily II metal-dependent hydrolase